MAPAPQFATHRFGSPTAAHTLEFYVDLICPFSGKQLKGVRDHVLPLLESNEEVGRSLSIVLRQVPQPWHASSTFVHEAALVVAKVAAADSAEGFADPKVHSTFQSYFLDFIINQQDQFYDSKVADETPNQTRARLAKIAAKHGLDEQKVLAGLWSNEKKESVVVPDLKLQVKYARQNSVHVTPTVALDGIIDPSVSSSFGAAEWKKYLEEKILPKGTKL